MDNAEKYKLLAEGEKGLPSNMGIIPRNNNFKFTQAHIEQHLRVNKNFKLVSFSEIEQEDKDFAEAIYEAEIEYLDETFNVELCVFKSDGLNLQEFGFANQVDDESLQIAMQQSYYLGTSMYFGEDALSSFHLQLKVMDAVVPSASLVIDFMSYRLLSAQWLSMTAKSPTPPSPDYLYTLHCVYDEEGKDGARRYWFHTHGLHRCGSVELEMLNIEQGAEEMHTMINMVVKKFLTDPTQEKERFTIGYDGMGINLCWLKWEEAVNDFPKDILGSLKDREGDSNVHTDPSGILFAVEDGNMVSPEIYASTLAKNPIYYITTAETERMSDLAKERFGMFKQVFDQEAPKPEKKSFLKNLFGSKKEDAAQWSFLVKLGLTVDSPETGSEKEHLWFEVLSTNGDKVEGKLLNQPYWIAGLNEGNINTYPKDLLTDWIIYSPDNTYTPDTIYQLGFS